LLKIKDTVL